MILLFSWFAGGPADAQDPLAERTRLEDELVRLAQRNTWSGVERTYQRLVALDVELRPQDHYLAAQAALARGDVLLGWYRLRRARTMPPVVDTVQQEAAEAAERESDQIDQRYGLVSVYVGADAVPALLREGMPFGQQERDAILAAQRLIGDTHAFRGLLPIGTYALDGQRFEVSPSTASGPRADPEWLVVTAGTP